MLLRSSTTEPVTGDDLELLALAAYVQGLDDDYVAALEQAHEAHIEASPAPAVTGSARPEAHVACAR